MTAGFCCLHCRLRLCRRRWRVMAGSCWLYCRLSCVGEWGRKDDVFMLASLGLRLCRRSGRGMAGSCWLDCRLRLCSRGGGMAVRC